MSHLDQILHSCIRWEISLGLLMNMNVRINLHVELSQYDILDVLVTQYILESRNINNYLRLT